MAARPLALRISSTVAVPSPISRSRRSASVCSLPRGTPHIPRSSAVHSHPSPSAHFPPAAVRRPPFLHPRAITCASFANKSAPIGASAGGAVTHRLHRQPGDCGHRRGALRVTSAMAEAGGLIAGGAGERSTRESSGSGRVRVRQVGDNPTEIIDLPPNAAPHAGWSDSSPPAAVLVVPGNPGVCAYYEDFALALHSALGGGARVVVVGHVAHTEREMEGGRLYSLQQQIQHKIRFIEEETAAATERNTRAPNEQQQLQSPQPPTPPQQQQQEQQWIVIGHSIGAHIALEMRRQLPGHVAHVVGLFPFLAFNHHSHEQHRLKLIASLTPLLAVVAALLQLLRVLPGGVLRQVVRWGVGREWSQRAVGVTASAMLRYNVLRNYAYMGHTEFKYFSQREFDWPFLSDNAQYFTFVFGEDDHWGPLHMHQEIQERVPGVEVYVDEEGHEHTFCCTDKGSSKIAIHVAKILRSRGMLLSQ